MAKLGIQGNSKRGNEVIEILQSLGGKNHVIPYSGVSWSHVYYIDEDGFIQATSDINGFYVTNVQDFKERFPFKIGDLVGDKVITSLSWDEENSQVWYNLGSEVTPSSKPLEFKAKISPERMKELADKLPGADLIYSVNELPQMSIHIPDWNRNHVIDFGYCIVDKTELILGDKFEIMQEGDRTFVVRKENYWPKTYLECCKVVGICTTFVSRGVYSGLLSALAELLVCRDAYWKLAGDWKPDFGMRKSCLSNVGGDIRIENYKEYNAILASPDHKTRTIFYENFKDLIEQCKELL